MFFHRFRNRPGFPGRGRTSVSGRGTGGGRPGLPGAGAERSFLRIFFVLVIFGGMCWAFWANSQRYIYKFSAGARLEDELGAFSKEQREEVIRAIARFDREYSLKLHVQTSKELFTSADAVSEGIFLGVCPSRGQVVVFMPPILRAALGEGVAAQMRDMVESAGFADAAWTGAAIKALLVLEASLERFGSS